MSLLRESEWEYKTSWSGGGSLGALAATLGELYFKDPNKYEVRFKYGGVGAGGGLGLKLPKLPKNLSSIGLSVSPTSFDVKGSVYLLPQFEGKELSKDDFKGACVIFELGGAAADFGYVGTMMLIGGDTLLMLCSAPPLFACADSFIKSFKAVAFLGGESAGVGGGLYAYLGYLGLSEIPSEGIWKVQSNGETFYYRFFSNSTAEWATDARFTNVKGKGYRVMNKDFMLINWESGDKEEWNLPLTSESQTGTWYPKPKGDGLFPRYEISAERIR